MTNQRPGPGLRFAEWLERVPSTIVEDCDRTADQCEGSVPSVLDPTYWRSGREKYETALSGFAAMLFAADWSACMLRAARDTLDAAIAADNAQRYLAMPRTLLTC